MEDMKAIADMSDRELLEEAVSHMRAVMAMVEAFEESPMMQAMMSGKNPILAMMGNQG